MAALPEKFHPRAKQMIAKGKDYIDVARYFQKLHGLSVCKADIARLDGQIVPETRLRSWKNEIRGLFSKHPELTIGDMAVKLQADRTNVRKAAMKLVVDGELKTDVVDDIRIYSVARLRRIQPYG